MEKHPHFEDLPPHKNEYGTARGYGIGFVWSLALTLAAYVLAVHQMLTGWALDVSIALLAVLQAWIQLALFVHVWKEPKPRWNLLIFLFMIMVVFILVFGSIWIMNNLNYNLMPG